MAAIPLAERRIAAFNADEYAAFIKASGECYRHELRAYKDFVAKPVDRGHEVALYQLIQQVKATATKDGDEWGEGDKEALPSWSTLEQLLTTDGYYGAFKRKYITLTDSLDRWAAEVANNVTLPEVRTYLQARAASQTITDVEETIENFGQTKSGREALQTLFEDETGPHHPLQLITKNALNGHLDAAGKFDFAKPKAADPFGLPTKVANLVAAFSPAFLLMVKPTARQQTNLQIIGRTLSELADRFVNVPNDVLSRYTGTPAELDDLVTQFKSDMASLGGKLKGWAKSNSSTVAKIKSVGTMAGTIGTISGLYTFFSKAVEAVVSPTAERIRDAAIEGGRAFVGGVNFVESLSEQYGKLKGLTKAMKDIGVTILRDLLGPLLDGYDVFVSTVGAIDRYEVGDHSAMLGHGMQAVGAGIGMGWGLVGAYTLIKGGTALSMSGIGLAVGLLSVAIGLIGLAIVTWTSESWLELFFENCRFGELWTAKAKQNPSPANKGFFERPDTEFFKWYDATRPKVKGAEESWETRPNVARQASEFLTAAVGLDVQVTMPTSPGLSVPNKYLDGTALRWDRKLRRRHNDWTEVEVKFEIPDEFPEGSTIVLKRVDPQGAVYDVSPIWRTKLEERAPVVGLPKGNGGARYVVPETVVYHTSTGSNKTTWNLHLAGKIIKPGSGQQMRGVGDTVDILFGADTVPAYLEVDVIPGPIETKTTDEKDEICRRSGEAVVYRDRVETVERV